MNMTDEIYKLLKKENFNYADLEKAYNAAVARKKREEDKTEQKKKAIDIIAEQFKVLAPNTDVALVKKYLTDVYINKLSYTFNLF